MTDRIDHWPILILAVLLLVASVGIVLAASYQVTETGRFQSDTNLTVIFGSDRSVDDGNPSRDVDGDGTFEGLEFDNSTFSADGDAELTLESTGGEFTNISTVDATNNPITVNRTKEANATVTVSGQVTAANVTQVNVSKNKVDLIVTAATDSTTVTIQTGGSGVVAEDFDTGTVFDEASPKSDGTVNITPPSGTTKINLKPGPDNLLLRNATNATKPVSVSGQVEIRLFERGSDKVFVRQANGDVVPFAGLPKTERFVAIGQADHYAQRRTLIDSIIQQNELYLLNKTAVDTVNVTFAVQDRTGEFGLQSTLQVERALNVSGSPPDQLRYRTVAGDEIGQKGEFSTTLQRGIRYRLILTSGDGSDQRQLGTVLVDRGRVYNLIVTGISTDTTNTADGGVINTTQEISGTGGSKQKDVTFTYVDPSNATTQLDVTVHEAGNASNQFDQFSASQAVIPLGTFKYSNTFTGTAANTTLVANFTITRGGEARSGVTAFGVDRFPVDIPLSNAWKQIFGVGMLLVVGGLFSIGNARIGALIIPVLAFVLNVSGILDGVVALSSVALAFTLAVGINIVKTTDQGVLAS